MYVGVLAQLKKGSATSNYRLELKIDKCNDFSCTVGNGNCNTATGVCECNTYPDQPDQPMWQGSSCNAPVCPAPASGIECSGNGVCQEIDGKPFCACYPGYKKLNNTLCELAADGQLLPISVMENKIMSESGYVFSTRFKGNEKTSLGLGKYQMFKMTFSTKFTTVTVNVTGEQAVDGVDAAAAALQNGRPDMIVAVTDKTGLKMDFDNIDLNTMDYEGWVARDLESHDALFKTSEKAATDGETWYVTVLSTAYARSALDYKLTIKGTKADKDSDGATTNGDCTRLSWEYGTCSGGQGTCSLPYADEKVCECKIDPDKGLYKYNGKTCGQKVFPVPSYKLDDPSVTDSIKMLVPGKSYVSGKEFGEATAIDLEPGNWDYYVIDSRGAYNSLTFKMSVGNSDLVKSSGVLAPLLLVKSAEGGGSLPTLETDPKTLFDFEGSRTNEQTIVVENTENEKIANRYYVAVYNQRYSGAALRYTLTISSSLANSVRCLCCCLLLPLCCLLFLYNLKVFFFPYFSPPPFFLSFPDLFFFFFSFLYFFALFFSLFSSEQADLRILSLQLTHIRVQR